MPKNNIGLLVYQIGPVGSANVIAPPTVRGFTVRNMINGPVNTWKGDYSNPLATNDSGVDETLRYKVYSYVEMATPSQSGVQRFYVNKTVDQILADINA